MFWIREKWLSYFNYVNNELYIEQLPVRQLAERYGTPLYVYSAAELKRAYTAYQQAFFQLDASICYAVKANSNLSILRYFAQLGAGFDIVSGGELARVLAAGGKANKVLFAGVGKSVEEMQYALEAGIRCFNVESVNELHRLNKLAASMNCQAPISLRVNPDVDAKTHPYISTGLKDNKFGIPYTQALDVYLQAKKMSNLKIVGIDCHIGSQLLEIKPLIDALKRLLLLVDQLKINGMKLEHIDIGGGIGIRYDDEQPADLVDYAHQVGELLSSYQVQLILEPGRSLVGKAGALITKIEYLKQGEEKIFAIVDAGMNDLIRPALYEAYHNILPVKRHQDGSKIICDVVGPICESSDFIGKDRVLVVKEQDLLVVCDAGAYGAAMMSNYNTRLKASEVMVDGKTSRLIAARQTIDELLANEKQFLQ